MESQTLHRRSDDSIVAVIASRMEHMHADMGEMREALKGLTDAVVKLALVEERQAQAAQAQERAFKIMEKLEERVEQVRKEAVDADAAMNVRVKELELAEPMQRQTSQWVLAAVWGFAGLCAGALAGKLLGAF